PPSLPASSLTLPLASSNLPSILSCVESFMKCSSYVGSTPHARGGKSDATIALCNGVSSSGPSPSECEPAMRTRDRRWRPPIEITEQAHGCRNDESAHQRRIESDRDRHTEPDRF